MIRSVLIVPVPDEDIPNQQWDDWRVDADGRLQIRIADHLSVATYWRMVIHALTEAVLCEQHGVPTATVDAWDEAFVKLQSGGQYDALEEPGEHPRCPYRTEHAAAMLMEVLFYHQWMKSNGTAGGS